MSFLLSRPLRRGHDASIRHFSLPFTGLAVKVKKQKKQKNNQNPQKTKNISNPTVELQGLFLSVPNDWRDTDEVTLLKQKLE